MTEKDLKKENKATDTEKEKQPLNEETMDKVSGGNILEIIKSQKELKKEDESRNPRITPNFIG